MKYKAFKACIFVIGLSVLVSMHGAEQAEAVQSKRSSKMEDVFEQSRQERLLMEMVRLAKRDDKAKKIHSALFRWQVVADLDPKHAEAQERIRSLETMMKSASSRYAQIADNHMVKKQLGAAYKNYLRALSYNPKDARVLKMVKDELNAKSVIPYTAEKDTTLANIARGEYSNSSLAFIIAYYNDIELDAKILKNETIQLPVMIGVVPKRRRKARVSRRRSRSTQNLNKLLTQANNFLAIGKFQEAAEAADDALAMKSSNKQARELKNKAYYSLGEMYEQQNALREAAETYQEIIKYLDTKDKIARVKIKINQEAEQMYTKGVQYYVQDDLENAIEAFDEVLEWNPNHAQAKKSLAEARALREKLENLR